MAQNKVTFEVIVTDKGTQKIVIKDLEALGDSVERVKKRQKDADKTGKEFFDTQKKGVIGTANSTKSFSKLAETLGSGSGGVVGAYATLAANVFAVTAAFNALRQASQVEQVFRGLEAAGARTGQTLSIVAENLKTVTGNAISTEQALRSTAQIASAGFGAKEIEALGKAARDTSFALGRNLTDSLDRLTRGVVKLEPELLDELGIMTKINESNTKYAAVLNKNVSQLSNFEKRQGFLNAVLDEANLKFGGLSESAGNSTAYDKLASNFSDLTNTILNFINVAAKPLAGILGSSQGALAGAAVLFAAGISKQLLPGLANLSKKSLETAAASKEQAKQARAAATAELAKAKAAGQAAIDAARSKVSAVPKGPKAFNDTAESIAKGTASVQEQDRAYSALNRSINTHQKQLDKMDASDTANIARKNAIIDQLKAQRDAIDRVRTAEIESANTTFRATADAQAAEQRALAASQKSKAADRAANATIYASQLQISSAYKNIASAIASYSRSEKTANNGAISRLGALRVAAFAASVSIRAIGAAFLAAIPIVGQIMLAVGLLTTAWDALKSDKVKAQEKALEDFLEVIRTVAKSQSEYNKIQLSTASESLRAQQAITIQSNSVQEIVDAYNAATKAQSDFIKQSGESSSVATFWESFTDKRSLVSYRTGIAQNSKVLDLFQKDLENVSTWKFRSLTDELKPSMLALDNLAKSAPEATEEVINLHGGFKTIESLRTDKKLQVISQVINEINQRSGPAAEMVKDLVEALKEADQAAGEFFRGAVQTTSYDKLALTIDQVVNSINAFELSVAKGSQVSKDWEAILKGIGPNIGRLLSPDSAKLIEQSNRLDAIIQNYKSMVGMGKELSIQEKAQLANAQDQKKILEQRAGIISADIKKAQEMVDLAQRTERSIKAQLTLAQARLTANQANYQVTAQGEGARITAENKIKDLQIQSLKTQQAIVNASLAQQRAKLTQLEIESKITEELKKQGTEQLKNNIETARAALDSANRDAAERKINLAMKDYVAVRRAMSADDLAVVQRVEAANKALTEATKRYADLEQFKGIEKEIAALEDASKSLANEIAAIFESKITPAEKLAAMASKEVEIQSARLATLAAQRNTAEEINQEYLKQSAMISGRTDTLKEQLRILTATYALDKKHSDEDYASKRAALQDKLRVADAASARAQTQEDKTANQALKDYYAQELSLLDQGYKLDQQRLEVMYQTATLEKVLFDTRKEGLEWQQTSLEYLSKARDAQKSLVEATNDQIAAQTKLNLKKRGLELSDEGQQAIEIRAAAAAYKLAVEEVNIKKGLIDLEYALLDAQRQQLKEELTQRRDRLVELNKDGVFNSRIAQLNTTIDRITTVDTGSIAESLKKALDVNLSTQEAELRALMLPVVKGNNSIISFMEGIRARRNAREEARDALNTKPRAVERIAKADNLSDKNPALDKATQQTQELVLSNTNLITAINDWISAIQKQIDTTSSSQVLNASVQKSAKEAMEFFIKQGWTAAQAAGIVGNLQQESGKNLNTRADNGKHVGIAQWDPARAAAFAKMFGKEVKDATLQEQLKFIQYELETTHKTAAVLLKASTGAEEAAKAFEKRYEIAGGPSAAGYQNRINNAKALVSAAPVTTPIKPTITRDTIQSAVTAAASNDNDPIVVNAGLNYDPTLGNLEGIIPKIGIPPIIVPVEIDWRRNRSFDGAQDFLDTFDQLTSGIKDKMSELGPEGEVLSSVITGISSIGNASLDALRVFDSSTSTMADKISAVATVMNSALSTIQSVVSAAADAKITNIDREIAAEQKRDGKSAESLAKIQSLEKKKDEIAKKQFNTNKKLMMAQAVISTAAGVAQALSYGPIAGPILAALIAAMGAAQIAIISGTSYQSTANAASTASTNSSLTIGKRGESVDLAKSNNNLGGELGYIRGQSGYGNNSSNYALVGSAYGGDLPRGYGNTAYMVGEKGPEILTPETPVSITPVNDNQKSSPISAEINIHAIDAKGMEGVLRDQRGNIISMLREAANSNGQRFLEDVDVNVYTRPNVGRL